MDKNSHAKKWHENFKIHLQKRLNVRPFVALRGTNAQKSGSSLVVEG